MQDPAQLLVSGSWKSSRKVQLGLKVHQRPLAPRKNSSKLDPLPPLGAISLSHSSYLVDIILKWEGYFAHKLDGVRAERRDLVVGSVL